MIKIRRVKRRVRLNRKVKRFLFLIFIILLLFFSFKIFYGKETSTNIDNKKDITLVNQSEEDLQVNNQDANTNSNRNSNTNSNTNSSINSSKIIENKDEFNNDSEKTEDKKNIFDNLLDFEKKGINENCTWKTSKTEIPIKVYVKNITKETVTKYRNKSSSFAIDYYLENYVYTHEEVDDGKDVETGYNEYIVFAYESFKIFYDNVLMTGWFKDSDGKEIANYVMADDDEGESTDFASENIITLINNGNRDSNYKVIRRFPTENWNLYYIPESGNEITVHVKKKEKVDIKFPKSIMCYHLGNNETRISAYYQEFLDVNKNSGLRQKDFIVFGQKGEVFACVRPRFIVIPEITTEEYKETKTINNSYYKMETNKIETTICE